MLATIKSIIADVLFFITEIIKILFSVFPIKKNQIFLFSYRGNKFACNQKAFCDYLQEINDNTFDVVVGYRNIKALTDIPKNVKAVKMCSLRYFYYIYTSKYVMTNQRVSSLDFYKKRKNQIYIQTWHASAGLKKSEKDSLDDLPKIYVKEAIRDSKMCNYTVSGSKQISDFYKRAFWYDGPILEIGTMRNDCFFNITDERKEQIKDKYHLPKNKIIVLYAPTFRNKHDLSIDFNYDYGLDFERINRAIEKKFGKNLIILKQHPNLLSNKRENTDYCIDMTEVQDIQELLLVTDILISDYSSVMFDYLLMKRPLFIFAKDFDTYSRDFLINLEDLPCNISRDSLELEKNIEFFNNVEYIAKLEMFNNEFIGTFETGEASKKMYNLMIENKL